MQTNKKSLLPGLTACFKWELCTDACREKAQVSVETAQPALLSVLHPICPLNGAGEPGVQAALSPPAGVQASASPGAGQGLMREGDLVYTQITS